MEFKINKTIKSLSTRAFEAVLFLNNAYEQAKLSEITNFDEIIDILDETIQDYDLALSQLESNHIEH